MFNHIICIKSEVVKPSTGEAGAQVCKLRSDQQVALMHCTVITALHCIILDGTVYIRALLKEKGFYIIIYLYIYYIIILLLLYNELNDVCLKFSTNLSQCGFINYFEVLLTFLTDFVPLLNNDFTAVPFLFSF